MKLFEGHKQIANMRLLLFLPLILLLLWGCKRPEQPPEFKGINNIKFREANGDNAIVDADALFFNPNDVKMKLRKIDVEVFLKEEKVGIINQDMRLDIPANADFTVPLEVSFDMRKIGKMDNILGALFGATLPLRFSGHVRASAHGIRHNVPVNYKDEIKLNL